MSELPVRIRQARCTATARRHLNTLHQLIVITVLYLGCAAALAALGGVASASLPAAVGAGCGIAGIITWCRYRAVRREVRELERQTWLITMMENQLSADPVIRYLSRELESRRES